MARHRFSKAFTILYLQFVDEGREIAGYSKVHFISDLPQAMRIVRNSALIENLSPIRRLGAILMSLCLGLLDSKSSDVLVVEFYK